MSTLLPRHGHDHFANVKYGYIVLGLSIVYFCVVVWLQKRPRFINSSSVPRRLSSVWLHFSIWVLVLAAFQVPLLHEFSEHLGTLLKRLGRVGYALVPLNLVLIIKPNVVNYLNLVVLHKMISRTILVLAVIHSVGFIIKWIVEGSFEKVFRLWNFLGVVIFVPFVVLLVVSLRFFRARNYRVFFWVHQASLVIFIALINLHARPQVTFITALNVVLLVLQIVLKYNKLSISLDETQIKQYGALSVISFERPDNYPISAPGSHLVLSVPGSLRQLAMPSHPFTIINNHENINLIVSTVNKFQVVPSTYMISYPYSSTIDLSGYENKAVTLFIGGSGISFALSIITYYQNLNKTIKFSLIWCVRNQLDLQILDSYNLACDTHLFVTNGGLMGDIELQDYEVDDGFTRGRPNLADFDVPDLLVACGPHSLIETGRAWAKTHTVDFISEHYNY